MPFVPVAVAAAAEASREAPFDARKLRTSAASSDTASTSASPGVSRASSLCDFVESSGVLADHLLPTAVQPWTLGRFTWVAPVQGAPRNRGRVICMLDGSDGTKVAVKEMPNDWVCEHHNAFVAEYPCETERPWVDVACMSFLRGEGFPYTAKLRGVFRDDDFTRVLTAYAPEGDFYGWCSSSAESVAPGPAREHLVRPLLVQTADAIRWLHDLSLVHGDISMENILVARGDASEALTIQLIDFGCATSRRFAPCSKSGGKEAYRAPETFDIGFEHDGFLSDTFALGVVVFCALFVAFPWQSTSAENPCPSFEHFRTSDFRTFARRRKIPAGGVVADRISFGATDVLVGLLAMDTASRLTLGEAAWMQDRAPRPSAWQLDWFGGVPLLGARRSD